MKDRETPFPDSQRPATNRGVQRLVPVPASWQTTYSGALTWLSIGTAILGLLATIDFTVPWFVWVPAVAGPIAGILNSYLQQDHKPSPPPGTGERNPQDDFMD